MTKRSQEGGSPDSVWDASGIDSLEFRLPYLEKLIKDHFPADKHAKILDLGCGQGVFLETANKHGFTELSGIDSSPYQVTRAKERGTLGVSEGDLRYALQQMPDEEADVVLAFDVMEHFELHELPLICEHVFRVLSPGGKWIIHTCNGESPFFGAVRYGDITHRSAFTRSSLAQLLFVAGFSEVRCFEDQPLVHGVRSAIRWATWKTVRGLLWICYAAETGDVRRGTILSRNLLAVALKPTGVPARR